MSLSSANQGLLVVILVILAFPLIAPNDYFWSVANHVFINAAIGASFCLLVGAAGQVSLGHAAFFAAGGYGSAILTSHFGWHPVEALLTSALLTALFALVISWPLLRLRGHYLAIATLGIGILIGMVLNNEIRWTGGPDGMQVPPLHLLGVTVSGDQSWYWLLAVLLVVNLKLALNLVDSPAGRALRSIQGSEIAAEAAGVDVKSYKVWIFVYSASVATLFGSLAAHQSGFIVPNTASFMNSINYIMIVVIGGVHSVFGALLGAVIVTVLPNLLAGYEEYEMLLSGILLLATIVFLPQGLAPALANLVGRRVL